jgi:hypothetical protein
MCFSAGGSFAAATLLTGIGSVSLARTASPSLRLFAAIPLLFSAQQAAEGFVWLSMNNADEALLQHLATNTFLAFALIIWPMWLPAALQRMELNAARRRLLLGLTCAGFVVATYNAILLVRWPPLAQIAGHSIRYFYTSEPAGLHPGLSLAAYAVPTVASFFVSSARLARVTGMALVVSLVAAFVIERDALTSVWCFFAALLSGLVLGATLLEQRSRVAVASAP